MCSPAAGGRVASHFHKVEHRLVSLISWVAFVLLPDAAVGNCLHVNKTRSACSCRRHIDFLFWCEPSWLNLEVFILFLFFFFVVKVVMLANGTREKDL